MCSVRRARTGSPAPIRTCGAEHGPLRRIARESRRRSTRSSCPEKLGFGAVVAPVMFSAEWRDGRGDDGELAALRADRDPARRARAAVCRARVRRHEGLLRRPTPGRTCSARTRTGGASRARPQRLSMPEGAGGRCSSRRIDSVAGACRAVHPARDPARSLYLRPFLFGTEAGYMLRNSHEFRFMVIANPVESYATGPMRVAMERRDVRAAVGGVGTAKASANYAASLRASSAAAARGCTVALWLDAREQRYIQELSGMNLFAVIRGELHTPELDGAILPGITRDSLLALAPAAGLRDLHERRMRDRRAARGYREPASAASCSPAAPPRSSARSACWRISDGREYAPRETRCRREEAARGAARDPGTPRAGPVRLDARRRAVHRNALASLPATFGRDGGRSRRQKKRAGLSSRPRSSHGRRASRAGLQALRTCS